MAALNVCLVCAVTTSKQNRRMIDTLSPVIATLKRLFNFKLGERGDQLNVELNIDTLFNSEVCVCRNCFNSITTFSNKEASLLINISKVLDYLCESQSQLQSQSQFAVCNTPSRTVKRRKRCHEMSLSSTTRQQDNAAIKVSMQVLLFFMVIVVHRSR